MIEHVLLVGFGGPESMERVPAFVASVLGREPPPPVLRGVTARYLAIGGGSPLPATTRRQAYLLQAELASRGRETHVYVGMLHAEPTIAQAADQIRRAGAEQVKVLSLAPYRCEVSTDAYEAATTAALGTDLKVSFVPDWNLHPGYVDALAATLGEAVRETPADTPVLFTAHSLPRRMIEQGDPYVQQLTATATAVAGLLALDRWSIAYQSVSAAAREPWLEPSVEDAIDALEAERARSVLVDPIGFVSDHVETLYDNDIEHRAHAEARGLQFYRCTCLNTQPSFISALADLVVDV